MREIVITAGKVAIRARLLDTPTADRIWNALPILAPAKTWGKELYFQAALEVESEAEARDVVRKGEIVFWTEGDAIAIAFGPTPLSKRGEIRLASPCNVWAIALDDVDQLKCVYAGESVTVIEAEPRAAEQPAARTAVRPQRTRAARAPAVVEDSKI